MLSIDLEQWSNFNSFDLTYLFDLVPGSDRQFSSFFFFNLSKEFGQATFSLFYCSLRCQLACTCLCVTLYRNYETTHQLIQIHNNKKPFEKPLVLMTHQVLPSAAALCSYLSVQCIWQGSGRVCLHFSNCLQQYFGTN